MGQLWAILPRLFRVVPNIKTSANDCYFWDGSRVSRCGVFLVAEGCTGLRHLSTIFYKVFLLTFLFAGMRKTFTFGSLALQGVSLLDIFMRFPPWLYRVHLTYTLCCTAWFPQGSRSSSGWWLLIKSLLWII